MPLSIAVVQLVEVVRVTPPTEPSRQPLEVIHSVGGSPPVPDPVDSSVPGLVALNHISTDSPDPLVPAKYPPGTLIWELLPPKPAAVPSANPVGPVSPSVTSA